MKPKLVLFGDSITECSFGEGGWGASLAHHFCRKIDVVLRGYSGYNTRWARLILEKSMDGIGGAQPAAVVVFFGANDASLTDQPSGYQHVPIAEYKENLKSIYAFFKKQWPSTIVIFITPPPIDEEARVRDLYGDDSTGQPERTNEAAGNYANACISVAKELGSPFIDIYSKFQEVSGWQKSLLSDGLHFSGPGNKFLFDEVVNTLKDFGLNDETLPYDLPIFLDIDPNDPEKSLSN